MTTGIDETRFHLRIKAAGLCSSVGYTARASACALRAGMDHFQESDFQTQDGHPVRVARLPDEELWGAQRLSRWMAYAMQDCLEQAGPLRDSALTMLVLCAQATRPGAQERQAVEALLMGNQILGIPIHPQSLVGHNGRAGLAGVLQLAKSFLVQGKCRQVMLLGADSLLNGETVNHYLHQERLLVPGNSDGFIPGEAAAAVLLELAPVDAPGLHLLGWGEAHEEGRPDGSVPTRAKGLSAAIRAAFEQADRNCSDLWWRLSDQNGESFFAGEAANAITRIAESGGTIPMVISTADCLGEVGAATGPVMLAWLAHLLHRPDGPGHCGMLHLANDDGLRSAVVVQFHPPIPSSPQG